MGHDEQPDQADKLTYRPIGFYQEELAIIDQVTARLRLSRGSAVRLLVRAAAGDTAAAAQLAVVFRDPDPTITQGGDHA